VPAVAKVENSGKETRNLECSDIMSATLKSSALAPIAISWQRPSMTSFGGCVRFFFSHLCQTLVDYNVEKNLSRNMSCMTWHIIERIWSCRKDCYLMPWTNRWVELSQRFLYLKVNQQLLSSPVM
jgi:hypothetical protein